MTEAQAERTATLSALVAEEIRAMMARRRMSGRELAVILGVSPSWVSYRLSGTQPIDLNDLELIAYALGVPVVVLLPPAVHSLPPDVHPSIDAWPDKPVRRTPSRTPAPTRPVSNVPDGRRRPPTVKATPRSSAAA